MKRIAFFIFAIALTSMFSTRADDFIQKVENPSEWDYYDDWFSFNDVGYSLPVFAENDGNNLNVTIYNNDWSVRSTFTITGVTQEDNIYCLSTTDGEGNCDYTRNFIASQYFFNDDDKCEFVIANREDYSYTNFRVINEDGTFLGNLPDSNDGLVYKIINNLHYIIAYDSNDKYVLYSFPGQTGAPMKHNNNDTNGDGTVTASDVTSVYNEILGL